MKISSVSKKVLASALSAAMVVAFAPTAAFAAIADFDDSGNPTDMTDEKAIAAGYNFKSVAEGSSANTGKLVTTYYKAEQVNGTITADLTMIADTDAKIVLGVGQDLDLNGHTLSYTKATLATDYALTATNSPSNNPNVIKNGTIETVDFTADGADVPTVVAGLYGDYHLTLQDVTVDSIAGDAALTAKKSVTVNGAVDAYSLTLDKAAKVVSGAIDLSNAAGVRMGEASSLEATATNKEGVATAIKGNVAMAKNATVAATAETTGNVDYISSGSPLTRDVTAKAIDGDVTMGSGTGASLTAIAKTSGVDTNNADSDKADATAITGTTAITVAKDQTFKAIASAADDYAVVTAVSSNLTANAGSSVEVSAIASTETLATPPSTTGVKDFALAATKTLTVDAGVKAATFKGYFEGIGSSTYSIKGGSYSMDPKPYVDATKFDIVDNSGLFAVQQAEGFTINGTITGGTSFATAPEAANIKLAIEAALDGKTGAATLAYAEGYDLAKVRALADGTTLKLALEDKTTTEKKATEAQKAALEAINAYAVKNAALQQKIENLNFTTAYLYFNDTKNDNAVVKVADVADFGSTVGSRNSTPNTVVIGSLTVAGTGAGSYAEFVSEGKVMVTVDAAGVVTPVEYVKDATATNYEAKVTSAPVAYVVLPIDINAIKDGATDKPETPTEKATQGIDVSKKSMTVKLGKATKTSKSKTFSMGASAETALTTSKKSGSKYITVKGQKVTLKKGVKKGTYTAKVSLKAAASDAYLAAAKTITVKFVVKK